MNVDYLIKETARNLRRNLTLTLASVLTVAVSLSLLGAALLLQKGVNNATDRWENGVEFIIWVQPDITENQKNLLQTDLDNSTGISSYRYVSQEEALKEFNEDYFPDNPEITQLVTAHVIPSSYRVIPAQLNAEAIEIIASGLFFSINF